YDPTRAQTLLAQAQTGWSNESPAFTTNVTLAAGRLNGQKLAPGATFSLNGVLAPYNTGNGYQAVSDGQTTLPTVEGGITQVSTTLFQSVFWSGIKIVERHEHPVWLSRYSAGSTAQAGLDAYVASDTTQDLRFQNNSSDWIRVEAIVQASTLTISLYGSDPGWSVSPVIGTPTKIAQPTPAEVQRVDPSLGPGQQVTAAKAINGFDVSVQRTVNKGSQVVDRYGVAEHYQPQPALVLIGPSPTATPLPVATVTATPNPNSPTPNSPTHLAGLNPADFV